MIDWVCQKTSERYILEGMLHVFHGWKSSTLLLDNTNLDTCYMIDAGSNTGFFGLVGMAMGCESIFFDV